METEMIELILYIFRNSLSFKEFLKNNLNWSTLFKIFEIYL